MKTITVAALFLIATTTFSQPRHIENDLNLTPDQRVAFDNARRDFETATQPLMDKQRDAHQKIEDALKSGTADACAIGAMVLDTRSVSDQLKSAHEAFEKKLSSILNPDQLARFESFEKQRHPPHGPPPDGPR